ncbi:DUF1513 domain-containing protein [Dongia deserti]|uniref:DUF1513 domain-containing protein n=1 Tax=Dongia deserti TaxID=2268030 RepID=UPI0013C4EAA2|nr:DUF1513 domain-containing protein [Dongia deserti]
MKLSRRALLASGAAALLVSRPAWASNVRYLSSAATLTGRYAVVAVGEDGKIQFDLDLAARGHGLALRPGSNEAVCFGRRPGSFALVIDTSAGDAVMEIPAAGSRHFSGHGLFVQGGDLLLATENDESKHQGAIGIYDARSGYKRIGAFPTFGIGPHDVALLPDGKTLVIANGGIDKRHDDVADRDLPDIRSDLVYVDWQAEKLLERVTLEPQFARLSIRHLILTAKGDVVAALQDSASVPDLDLPLGFLHGAGSAPRWVETPHGGWARLRGYCGEAAVDSSAGLIALSSPRGNCIGLWDETGAAIETLAIHDGCGLSATGRDGKMLVSSGSGELFTVSRDAAQPSPLGANGEYRFDNHMVRI